VSGSLLLRNGTLLDVKTGEYTESDLRIEDGIVVELGEGSGADVPTLDLHGAFVLPGLIDAHVHVVAGTADLPSLRSWPPTYVAYHAQRSMLGMLERGFTTVRDTGGADFGIADAQQEGLLRGPRLKFGGKAISQTGGHGDDRARGTEAHDVHTCCVGMGQVADGVDAVRLAARHELRKGADHIKVMASGGVASPTDRVDSTGYSMDELRAAVEEATAANRYVAAHAYTARAINRALEAGIRTIEHGNLLDESSVELFLAKDAFLVMNLVTYWALQAEGREHGLSETSWRKVTDVLEGGYKALELAHRSGVKVAYGTDLLGGMQRHQSKEFEIRADFQKPIDIIRSATSVAADLVNMPGQVGCLTPGAFGDLVIMDRNPVEDVRVLAAPEKFSHVVQGGEVVVSR
jgi:imidazolonepropionase-like amidohydrolase